MAASDATKHTPVCAPRPAKMGKPEVRLEFSDETTIKCYKCYSKKVIAVCHHCGRLLCKKCQFNPFGPLHTDNVFARIRPLSAAFKRSAHCEDCFHYRDTIARLVIPSILGIAAILILLPIIQFARQQMTILALPPKWAALVPLAPRGAGALVLLFLARLTWVLYPRLPFPVKYPLGIPVFPTYTIELHEHVKADFNITPDHYLPQHVPCGGQLTIKLGLVPEDEERYKSTPKPKPRDGKVTIHAGFVALDKQKNVQFLRKMEQLLGNGPTFPIIEGIAPDDFIRLCRERQPIEWTGHYRIDPGALRLGPKYDQEFPFFIKPRLLQGGRYLELMLELHKGVARRVTLERLTLNIPPGCRVEDTNGQFDLSKWEVAWREKKVPADTSLLLYIEFQQPLGIQPRSFKGEYKLIIEDYTISGLRVVEDPFVKGKPTATGRYIIRPASGSPVRAEKIHWMNPMVKHKTIIEGKVSFKTSIFSAYTIHTEPKTPKRSKEYPVSPNHKIVDAIIAALTHPKQLGRPPVYIQQVIETLGRVTETGTDSRQARCWEIKGRYYIGETHERANVASEAHFEWDWSPSMPIAEQMAVPNQAMTSNPFIDPGNYTQPHDARIGLLQPVDIHLIILGEEPRDDHPGDSSHGTLHFELVLRSVVGSGDQGMTDLQRDYNTLRKIIEEVIHPSGRR